ncbi:MAG: PadR family transcriptional regulator [Anaerolineales bacterium]|jgi:DNA-binding PadR family transcriptional regulator
MSAINLLILGFLLDRDWSAYELAQFIQSNDIDQLVKVSAPAIYRNMVKMADQNYLAVRVVKEGEMPEKKVYTITNDGRAHHARLLKEIAAQPVNYYFDFNTVTANLGGIPYSEGLELINTIHDGLQSKGLFLQEALAEHENSPAVVRLLIQQHQMLNQTLLEWLGLLESELNNTPGEYRAA